MAIGVLTGTFDPVHLGHVAVAKQALREFGLAGVWFVVNPRATVGRSLQKRPAVSLAERQEMVRLAVSDAPELSLYDGRYADLPHNRATFALVTGDYPDNIFEFIVGEDVLVSLSRWDDAESVVADTSFIVVSGRNSRVHNELPLLAEKLRARRLVISDDWRTMSSSRVRDQLAVRQKPVGLDRRIYEFIGRRNLYSMS